MSRLKRRDSEEEIELPVERQTSAQALSQPVVAIEAIKADEASQEMLPESGRPVPAQDERVKIEKKKLVRHATEVTPRSGQHAWAVKHGYELALDEIVHLRRETDAMVKQLSEAPDGTNSVDRQVYAAVHRGRWVEARRTIQEMEKSQDDELLEDTLGTAMRKRIQRVGSRFDESLAELGGFQDSSWTKDDDNVAFRLIDGLFQVVTTRSYENFDAFQAFVGLCEYDLCPEYLRTVKKAQLLQEDVEPSPNDTLWQVHQRWHTSKEDNILQVSCLDALNEPLGALWFSTYTPAEEEVESLEELRGVKLPPTQEGFVRVNFWRTVFAIEPNWTDPPSFKLTMALSRRPSAAAVFFSSVVQREAKDIMDGFYKHLRECSDLNGRALFSPRAPFYECVRRHLADMVPRGCRPPVNPLLRLKFNELSELLPEDWADHVDAATCKEAAEDANIAGNTAEQ